jgi:hypothetical protein
MTTTNKRFRHFAGQRAKHPSNIRVAEENGGGWSGPMMLGVPAGVVLCDVRCAIRTWA